MIKGTGCDLIETSRFRIRRNKKELLSQFLAPKELPRQAKARSKTCLSAVRFAEKEAILKALGCGLHYGSYWRDIRLLRGSKVRLFGFLRNFAATKAVRRIHATSSYSKKLALALALIET